jgi:nitroreductase
MATQPEPAALAQAAQTAGFAPSIHNTQPWRWRVVDGRLELYAARARQLGVTDPLGRMLAVSCGAALYHARAALAAEGWQATVDRVPQGDDADLLARVELAGEAPVTPAAMRRLQTIRVRHTDRRPVSEAPVPRDALEAVRQAVEDEGAHLHVLRPDDVIDLASAASHAQTVEDLDPEWREEMTYWASGAHGAGLGLPDDVIPQSSPETTVPGRDFGRTGTLPVGAGHDRAAVYAILYGDEDTPAAWLRAGEALCALWLTAIEHEVSALPLSAAIEVAETRQTLRRLLAGLGEPFLVVRLGIADPDTPGPAHTPRLPADQVVEIVH